MHEISPYVKSCVFSIASFCHAYIKKYLNVLAHENSSIMQASSTCFQYTLSKLKPLFFFEETSHAIPGLYI